MGLYRQDGVHLSDVGVDIFNLGLQYGIEMAVVVGVGPACGDVFVYGIC